MSFQKFAESKDIPSSTLKMYCCSDKSKRIPICTEGAGKTRNQALIPKHELKIFVKKMLRIGADFSTVTNQLRIEFGLNILQAHHQYYHRVRDMMTEAESNADLEETVGQEGSGSDGCTQHDVVKGGVCWRHGANLNTFDGSTASFGSDFDETTATLTLPNQRTYSRSSTSRGGRSNVPGEVTINCQEMVEV
jgi:hypothetical protein